MIWKICIPMLLVGIFSVAFGLLVVGQSLEEEKFFSAEERKTIPSSYRGALEFPTNRQIVEYGKTIIPKEQVKKGGWWYGGIIRKGILPPRIENDITVRWRDEEGIGQFCRFLRFSVGRFLVQVRERNFSLMIGVRDTKITEASDVPGALKESAFETVKALFNPVFVPPVPAQISIHQLSESSKEKGLKGAYGSIQSGEIERKRTVPTMEEFKRKPPIMGDIVFWSNRKVVVFKILKDVHVYVRREPPRRSDDPFR